MAQQRTTRLSTGRLATLTGLVLVAVIAVGALSGSRTIAADLQPAATEALASAGLDMVQVRVVGREAGLSGGAMQDRVRAERIVETIRGIRRVTIQAQPQPNLQVNAAAPDGGSRDTVPTLVLRLGRDGLRISGTVATADDSAEFKARAAEAFGRSVRGDLAVDAAVGEAAWVDEVPELFADLGGVGALKVRVDGVQADGGGIFKISGSVRSRAGSDRITTAVAALVPGLRVINLLTVDPGVLAPADATALDSTSVVFAPDTSTITADGSAALARSAEVLRRNPSIELTVSGHSGPDSQSGRRLGRARVLAVRAALVGDGVDVDRLSTVDHSTGRRTAGPVQVNDRRVVLIVRNR